VVGLVEVIRILVRLVFIVMIVFLTAPSAARGQEGQFIPTIYGFEGELDFGAAYEKNKNESNGRGYQTSDTYFVEKVVLSANGFVYHPRFLLFLAKAGGGLTQEYFENSNAAANSGGGAWRDNPLWEYEFRTLLLPEHPYNLELFALRQNPFIPGRITWGVQPVTWTEGALFTYKDMPWTFRLGYTRNSIESSESRTDTNTLNANGGYNVEKFSLTGSFSHSDSNNTIREVDSDYTTDKYSLQNQIRFFDKKFFLVSDVSQNSYETHQPTASLTGERFTWTEQLNMFLPYRFNAVLYYNHYRDTENSTGAFSGAESSFTSTTETAGFSLTHRLYESLTSSYNVNYGSTETPTGDYTNTAQTLNATYIKKIRGGRLISSGYLSRTLSDRNDAPMVLNEPHKARIGGEFPLVGTDIDGTSIRIKVIDPSTGIPFPNYLDNTHYEVIPDANTFRIRIKAVPPEILQPDPLYEYTFNVEYRSVWGGLEIQTSSAGFAVKLELLGGYFNPYYSYDEMTQKVLSGFVLGGPEESTTNTFGVTLERPPYFALLEHQDRQSRYNPWIRDRAEAAFRKDLEPTTYLNLHGYYTRTENFAGVFRPASPTETGIGGEISVQKRFPERNLTLNFGGSYAQRTFTYDTKTYTLNAALVWTREKLDVSFGANLSLVETALDSGTEESSYQRYFLLARRKLF